MGKHIFCGASPSRRRFLSLAAGGLAAGALALGGLVKTARDRLKNPCLSPELPEALQDSPVLARAWEGLDPAEVWDMHAHLAGLGDSGKGLRVGSKLDSFWRPLFYAQRLFYINAGCAARESESVDERYVARLVEMAENTRAGFKALLLAFDWHCDEDGVPQPEKSTFYVPNEYAREVAAAHPHVFAWAASVHPYRPDAVERLEAAAADGALAVKWLPATQNIDPASARCDAFFRALARLDLPLITHCGAEKATIAGGMERFGNPLRLRRALERGVRIVVAHCASFGNDEDWDQPGTATTSFALFARLMDDSQWKGRLFGDISAITLSNRSAEVIRALLTRADWHDRLLNGSDYPLPGVLPIVSLTNLATSGFLSENAVADLETLRKHNALYFDLALKRALSWKGQSFPARVFATRSFFERRAYV
ncbi:MAG: amidohydrolase family protein [Zoogloeaceae bacterium]|jgi:mannonate dehydratase|nr:amidohydrolase family protein [Zoogloeaceae bacterium]